MNNITNLHYLLSYRVPILTAVNDLSQSEMQPIILISNYSCQIATNSLLVYSRFCLHFLHQNELSILRCYGDMACTSLATAYYYVWYRDEIEVHRRDKIPSLYEDIPWVIHLHTHHRQSSTTLHIYIATWPTRQCESGGNSNLLPYA